MKIEYVKLNDLKEYEKNTKLHPADQVEKIAKSIEEFGFNIPVLIDAHNVLIAGHGRLAAARKLGLTEVPALRKTELSAEQVKAFRIADNKVAESDWDYDFLREEFDFLEQANYDLELTGFNTDEIDEIKPDALGDEDVQEVEADDADTIETDIEEGDIFTIGPHRLMCGDSTDYALVSESLMQGDKADISFTSPPYNAGKNIRGNFYENDKDNKKDEDYVKFLCNFTTNCLNNSTFSFVNLQILESNKYALIDYQHNFKNKIKDILIWNKKQYPPHINPGTFGCKWEYVFVFCHESKGRAFPASWQGKFSNVIETENASGNNYAQIHKATFPISFPTWIIEKMDFANSVLDVFGGTGSTMVAAHQLKRKCYMMELDPRYCQVIINRMRKLDPNIVVKCENRELEL